MQPVSSKEFLHNTGYGVLILPWEGRLALSPLVNPAKLPPSARTSKRYASVDEQAIALLSWYNLPGLAIGLIRNNKLVYARGYGVQSITSRKPMTEYSMIAIGSISKMLTGAAVMQLIETSKVGLDEPVVRYVPYFKMADPRYKDITVRHLLVHTSGLPGWTEVFFNDHLDNPWRDAGALERFIRNLSGETHLSQEPGCANAKFDYSLIGYSLLGALVQEVSGCSFEDYMRRKVLDPLHMFTSSFNIDEVKPGNLVGAHSRDINGKIVLHEPYPYARQLAPAALLYTNVVELSHFIMAHLNGGWYHYRILESESAAFLWSPLYTNPFEWPGVGYNAGCFVTNYVETGSEPQRMIISMGAMRGVNTHISVFPDRGIAAIVLVNLDTTAKDPCYSWGICDKLAIQLLHDEI